MYSLDVNFLNDRPIYKQKDQQSRGLTLPEGSAATPLYIGLAVGLLIPALVGGGWLFLNWQNDNLGQEIAQLDAENKRLDQQIGDINKLRAEIAQIKGETQALVSVFNEIHPWSATLQDLRDRIPAAVQIDNIKQLKAEPAAQTASAQGQAAAVPDAPGVLEITGFARTFNDVNDFLLTIQQSRFFKAPESRIVSAELVDAPTPPGFELPRNPNGVQPKPPKVVKYKIQSSLSDIPASELMRELEQKGTVGLVSRIRTLQEKGVIQK